MAERRQSGGNYVDGEAEGADAFPGDANLYSQDYADRFKSKKNEPSTLGIGRVDMDGGETSANDWNDQFGDDNHHHHSDDEKDERLPYIPYYQGNAGEDDDGDDDDGVMTTTTHAAARADNADAENNNNGGTGFTNISGASIVRRANGPDNL